MYKVCLDYYTRDPRTEQLQLDASQALNTVLAFVTSRKQLATTFPSIRSSVENVTKQ